MKPGYDLGLCGSESIVYTPPQVYTAAPLCDTSHAQRARKNDENDTDIHPCPGHTPTQASSCQGVNLETGTTGEKVFLSRSPQPKV